MSQALPANTVGSPFIELQSVDSTNNYARRQIHAGLAQHGMTFFAYEQTAGKGQRGRAWTSEKDKNIALSVLLRPKPLTLSQQFQLSACVAVAVHAFLMKYTIDKVKIKWPNDIYWQDRKAGGVLIESVVRLAHPGLSENRSREFGVGSSESEPDKTQVASFDQSIGTGGPVHPNLNGGGSWEWAIAGIGININQTVFPDHLPNPVSLKQITGRDHDPAELAKEFCHVFQHYFTEFITKGFENIFRLYNQHLYKLNEKVKLKKDNQVFEAMIKGVSPFGKLITGNTINEVPIAIGYDFADVEWIV